MREKQNNWQRIEAVIKWANMSTNYFARYIGLARRENLYQIKRGNNGKLWLLTGEGQMFSDEKLRGVQIPFYNVDVEQAVAHVAHLEAESSLMVPQAGQCDLAMCYMGRAMGPALPPGAVVLLKAVDPDAIIPGGEYVIVSRKIVTLRIVRLSDGDDKLRLVAGDKENYDDIILNVSDIKSVYKVKGKLIINS